MKSVFISLTFLGTIFLSSCGSKEDNPTDMVGIPATAGEGVNQDNLPNMKFEEDFFDFGTITQGEKVSHDFKFENDGGKELIISKAYGSCGCTVPEVPKKPIPAGESSMIKVTFDSEGKAGIVTKEVTIVTNCIPNNRIIKVKANIFVPETKNQANP